MKTIAFVVSWLALAVGIMLVVGGVFRVQVREAHRAYGDPYRQAAIQLLDGEKVEPYPAFRLSAQHVVIGSGIVVVSLPGVLLSLRRRAA